MNIETQQKLRPALLASTVFSIAMSVYFFYDWQSHRPVAESRLQHGQVVSREMTMVAGFIRRPLLTIKVEGTSDTVNSILIVNSVRHVPDRVSFYSPPADSSDVQLLEETSPLVAATFTFVLSVLCTGLLVSISKSSRRQSP
jgi:hypothetical protein